MSKPVFVVLSPGFAANDADTTCLPMQQQFIKTFKKNHPGIDIFIIAFQYPFSSSSYQWNGATVISLNGRNKAKLHRLFLWGKAWRQLKRLYRKSTIIGILSFWYGECALVGNRFAKKYSLKHFCWMLGQDAKKGNKYVKYAKLKGEELIALSDFLQCEFEKNYSIKPSTIISAGIDQGTISSNERDIDLLAVGSLISLKQFEIFIQIVSQIKDQFPGIKAVLTGEGVERTNLAQQAIELNLSKNISMTGSLPHQQVLYMMRRAKIVLHPSAYEGFGLVCIEALSEGAHVISFVQPMKESIEQWHIVKTQDQMAQKVIEILGNDQTSYKKVVFQSMEMVVQKMAGLFGEAFAP